MNKKKPDILLKLFNPGNRKARLTGAMTGLGMGFLLWLLAILVWLNFKYILSYRAENDSISEYLIIGKKITNDNMGRNRIGNRFSPEEISQLNDAPGVSRVGMLESNRFPVRASLSLGFQTDLFLEAAADDFMDVLPEDWEWTPGNASVPVILSSEFLNLYNYGFALSQGLPQISRASIQSIPFKIEIAEGEVILQARIVGFTDRISSVLVPQNFLDYMNQKYGGSSDTSPARLILKVRDPSADVFIDFLKARDYTVSAEQLRWNYIRTAVGIIVSIVGLVALLIIGMALLSLLLFLEVTVYRSAGNIRLLKQLGYTPGRLKQGLNRYFLSRMAIVSCLAMSLALGFQFLLVLYAEKMGLDISFRQAWPIFFMLPAWLLLLYLLTNRAALRVIYKL